MLQTEPRNHGQTAPDPVPLEFRLFGELAVLQRGRELALPASKKTRALLAYLVICRRSQRRERLCDLLWEGPEDPRAALRWSLAKLRPLVDAPEMRRLVCDKDQVKLDTQGTLVDLLALRELQAAGFISASTRALEVAVQTLQGGEVLEGLDLPDCHQFHEWHRAERESARRLGVELRLALIGRLETEPARALVHARAMTTSDPLEQVGHAAVIRLLGKLGRTKGALEQYEVCRRILDSQLRMRPSIEVEQARMSLGKTQSPPADFVCSRSVDVDLDSVSQRLHQPSPPPSTRTAADRALVGRDSERANLQDFIDGTGPNTDGVLLVLGEPGVGKSRLLAELGLLVVTRRGRVLSGRAFEAEMVRPYGAWIDALRGLDMQVLTPPSSGQASAGFLSDANADRAHLFESVVRQLRQLDTVGTTTVIVIDDVQWIDEASAALLHYASRALSGTRVRIACGARPGELGDNPAALRLIRTLLRETRVRQIGLSPLDVENTALLVRSEFASIDTARVYAESGGNPMYALEVARALAAGERPTSSLQALLQERLARLEVTPRNLVVWAAVFGRAFSIDLLFRVCALQTNDFLNSVENLERHGFIEAVDLTLDAKGYDFVHDLVRRAAYQSIPEPRRRLMHLSIARTLSEMPTLHDNMAGDIAHHAALGEDAELAARFSLLAAERSLRLFATREAAELAERGMRWLSRLGQDVRARLEIGLLRVLVQSDVGKRRMQELESAVKCALHVAHVHGCQQEVTRGLVVLAYFHFDRGDFDAACVDSWQISEMANKVQSQDAAYALAHAAQCLAMLERDIEKAESLVAEARSALGPYQTAPFELTLAEGLILQYRGDTAAGLERLARASDAAQEQGAIWLFAVCQLRQAIGELQRGFPDRTIEHCGKLQGVIDRLGEASEGTFSAIIAAAARRELDPHASDFDFDQALAALEAMDAKVYLAEAYCIVAEADLFVLDETAAQRHALQALRMAEQSSRATYIVWSRALLARIQREQGDLALARQQVQLALPLLESNPPPSAYARSKISAEAHRLLSTAPN